MLIDQITTAAPADIVSEELRSLFVSKDIRQGEVARRMGRSAPYVSTRLHGKSPFTEGDLGVIAEILDVPAPWFSYPGHTLRRLQERPPAPHKSVKVLLRMNGWRRTRNLGGFQVWENTTVDPVIALPISERLLSPTVAWWAIDVVTGVRLTPRYRFPVQQVWEVQVRREGDTWSVCLPYMRAYTQTPTLARIRDISTEFVAAIARKPIDDDLVMNVTVHLPRYLQDDWDAYQMHVTEGNAGDADHVASWITEQLLDDGLTENDVRILTAMPGVAG